MQVLISGCYQLFLYVSTAKLIQGHMTMHKHMSSSSSKVNDSLLWLKMVFTTTVTGRHQDEGTKLSRYWKKKDYGTRRKGMSADLSSKMEMMNS
jgi:hypothetical protein